MPAPSIIVTLIDADGDEFPVRIWGLREQWTDQDVLAGEAFAKLNELAKQKDRLGIARVRPAYPMRVGAVEFWNQEVE